MISKINSFYIHHEGSRIFQGDIFRDFEHVEWASLDQGKIKLMKRTIPYLVILTQDCDLQWDYESHNPPPPPKEGQPVKQNLHDKYLQSLLVCPVYHAEKVREGSHLKELNYEMEKFDSKRWNQVTSNNNSRYHFLNSNQEMNIPELVIDFKHYYTIPRDILYSNKKEHYLGTINELFRENLSQRFANYLSRIGLPELKMCKTAATT